MATMTMGEMLAAAEEQGFSSKDMSDGDYDVRVKRTMVKEGRVDGDARLLVTYEALSDGATFLDGQNCTPSNPKSLFYWFRFCNAMGITKEYFQANPGTTVENVGKLLTDSQDTFRIRIKPQSNNSDYKEVEILGDATGEPDVTAQASSPSPSSAEAPTPPSPPSGGSDTERPW